METIRQQERTRIYCCHDMQHLMDVARIMYIRVLSGEAGWFRFPVFDRGAENSAEIKHSAEIKSSVEIKKSMEIKNGRELIYAAALLHDIGRADQYENGTPHDEAGAAAAAVILADCGFDPEETELITNAIRGHRGTEDAGSVLFTSHGEESETAGSISFTSPGEAFSLLLREADKQSRLCFQCEVRGTCKWPDEKKNLEITI